MSRELTKLNDDFLSRIAAGGGGRTCKPKPCRPKPRPCERTYKPKCRPKPSCHKKEDCDTPLPETL